MKQSNLFSLQELHGNKWKLVGKMTIRNERPNCAFVLIITTWKRKLK